MQSNNQWQVVDVLVLRAECAYWESATCFSDE